MRQRLEDRSLCPVQHRRLRHRPAEIAIVEVTVAVLHMVDRPVRDVAGKRKGVGIVIGKERERVDRLPRALAIGRVRRVVVVLGSTVGLEEMPLEIFEPLWRLSVN